MEQYAVEWTEWLVHELFFWEKDNVKKGKIVRAIHHFVSNGLIFLVLVSHLLYPAFWLQTFVLFCWTIIWIQHVFTNGCIVSKVEQKLIGDESSFIDPILFMFHIELNEQGKRGFVTLGSTMLVSLLSLEWTARVFHKVIPFVRATLLSFSQGPHILPSISFPSG